MLTTEVTSMVGGGVGVGVLLQTKIKGSKEVIFGDMW